MKNQNKKGELYMGRVAVSDLSNVKIDKELKNLLPPLTAEEFEKLENNILKNGVLDPLKVWCDEETGEKYLIDGHNRKTICDKHNISIGYWQIQCFDSYDFKSKEDVIKWILENQLGRRNLSIPERYEILQKHKRIFEAKAKANMSAGGKGSATLPKVDTRKEMARMVGTSEGTYTKLDKIFNSDNEEIKQKVKANEISINKGFEQIQPEKQNGTVKKVKPIADKTIDEKIDQINSDLKSIIGNLSGTDECDSLLNKIEEHINNTNSIKTDIYLVRSQKYDLMSDAELSCEVEFIGHKDELDYKAFFYIAKTNGNTKNRKAVLEIYAPGLKDKEHISVMTKGLERKLPDNEYKLLMMKVWEYHKKAIHEAEEEKRKQKIEWEKIMEEARKLDEHNSRLQYIRCDSSTKEMLQEIVNQGYRQLVKKYHPDVSRDDGNQMVVLNNARQLIAMIIG